VGSRSKIINYYAYIAGFLDGDGSLMVQLKKRKDTKKKWRFMFTICFYQDSRHEEGLLWIKKIIGGYLSRRSDGITELRINGYKRVYNLLKQLKPFIRFKKVQVEAMMKVLRILLKTSEEELSIRDRKRILENLLKIQSANYSTKRKKTREELNKILELTP